MRYGRTSMKKRLRGLVEQRCGRILLAPLYPQYSATTASTVNDAAFRALMRMRSQSAIRTAPCFPGHPAYIQAMADRIRVSLLELGWQPALQIGSFHGLPRRYVGAGDPYPREYERTMVALRREPAGRRALGG
jgi:ferrochelatase